jgi:tetratricopeptide (TPR) repeat protein
MSALWVRPEQIDLATLAELIPGAAETSAARDLRIVLARERLAETASVHAVATELVARRAFDFCAVLYRGIEQFSHLFQRYAPPRMSVVSAAEHEQFGQVVAAVYALHDQMLGRLIELAGEGTTVIVCSDHGFATGGRRASAMPRTDDEAATLSHRPHGMLVMAGPHVRRDDTIEGASVMDVAPTVLTLLGLPVGDDMDGRPLVRALELPEGARVETTPSWDALRPLPPHAADHTEGAWDAAAHLLELGLRGPHATADDDGASMAAEDEIVFTLARAYLDAGRAGRAVPLLRVLAARRPDDVACHAKLFDALYLAGRYAEARAMVDAAVARAGAAAPGPLAELAYAALDVAERRPADALAHLARARDFGSDLPELHVIRGEAFLRLGRYAAADAAFGDALARDDRSERAWDGRAAALLGLRGHDEEAAAAALRAVGQRADHAPAHYHLGVALARLGRCAAAATALTRATDLRPELLPAHRRLAELFEGPLNDPAAARERRLLIARLSTRQRARSSPAC